MHHLSASYLTFARSSMPACDLISSTPMPLTTSNRAMTSLRTTISALSLLSQCTMWGQPSSQQRSPLTEVLDMDVLAIIMSFLAPADLASCARTCRAMHAFVTPALYTHVALPTYRAVHLFVRTLEDSAARAATLSAAASTIAPLGSHIRSFTEATDVDGPYFYLETHYDAPAPHLLARLLRHAPNLQTLRLASPIEISLAPELTNLVHLEELELTDATRETVDSVLPHIATNARLSRLRLTCLSVGWGSAFPTAFRGRQTNNDGSPLVTDALAACLLHHASSLTRLDIDIQLLGHALPDLTTEAAASAHLPPFPRLDSIALHRTLQDAEVATHLKPIVESLFQVVSADIKAYEYPCRLMRPTQRSKASGSLAGMGWARLFVPMFVTVSTAATLTALVLASSAL
ncbi:hypothetical protein BKA62DRAFT_732450 [Auriculariales sp. MPI-PUGE-AT-0066]|nr:hypothetical protein BKA62DRAFT_732450 [Auriculariales sp. MPI-PUGE-AT-0066]